MNRYYNRLLPLFRQLYDWDLLYEMQKKLIIVSVDIVQVFSLTLRAAELCLQQFNIQYGLQVQNKPIRTLYTNSNKGEKKAR